MKKIVTILLLVVMLFSVTACSSQTKNVVLTTGGTTGVYYIFGGEIAAMLSSNIPGLNITTQTSGGSKDNVLALIDGEAEMGIMQNDVMSYAYSGTDDFGGKPVEGFSAIASLFPECVQVVVAKDSGITSVADLKGKNVGIGAVGSGAYFNVIQILEMAGLTLNDIHPQYLSFGESSESFQNRQIDAFFVTGPYGHSSIVDAALKRDLSILSFSEDEIDELQSRYGFYVSDVIPAGTYNGVDEEITCPAVTAVLVASDNLDEDIVYNMTKNLFEHKNELTNAKKDYLSTEFAVQGVPVRESDKAQGISAGSFHPGALKYYQEIGLLK